MLDILEYMNCTEDTTNGKSRNARGSRIIIITVTSSLEAIDSLWCGSSHSPGVIKEEAGGHPGTCC